VNPHSSASASAGKIRADAASDCRAATCGIASDRSDAAASAAFCG